MGVETMVTKDTRFNTVRRKGKPKTNPNLKSHIALYRMDISTCMCLFPCINDIHMLLIHKKSSRIKQKRDSDGSQNRTTRINA